MVSFSSYFSASQFISENISSTSCEIDVPPPPSRVLSTHEVADRNEIQRMTPVESVSFDEKVDSEAKNPVGSTEQEIALCPVIGTEKHNVSDTSRQLSCETVSNCLQNLGANATVKIGEPQGTLSDNVNQECTKEVGVAPVLCESTEKQGDEVTVPFINDGKEAIKENHHKSPLKISGNL